MEQDNILHGTHELQIEEAEGHDSDPQFIWKYIFSKDHKIISKQYLITAMCWAVIGAFFSVLFRLQLGFPDIDIPFLEKIIGQWGKHGRISADVYYSLITMHGTVLIFFVLTAGLSGTFSNLLIPLQIGARDMASPLLNMLSYWLFFAASIVMFSSLFVQSGPSANGWTAYPPLSALKAAGAGSGTGMDLWLLSLILFVASTLLSGINFITTILNLRTKGMSMTRLPLTIWSFLLTAILGVLSFPVLLSSFVLLLFDRHAGTSFFLSEIFINGRPLPNVGGSAILYQHLFWFLGHPEVYIVILPSMGIASDVLSTHSRKPVFGYNAMVISLAGITFLSFLVWSHHMFVSGMNPFLGSVFTLTTLMIAVPSAVKVFNWLTTIWRGNIHFTPAMLFALGFISTFISGGLTGIFIGDSFLDIHLHDTYFIIAHFHIVMAVSAFMGMFAGIYHWYPKMFGRQMNSALGYIHFFITFIGAYLIFWPMHYEGIAGMPRRYFDFTQWKSFSQFQGLNAFISIVTIVVFIGQFVFLLNFFLSIVNGRKLTTLNPWRATTLEWTTPSLVPQHGNWPGEIPEVHRWAYDYRADGKGNDFIPQNSIDRLPVTEPN